MFIYIFVVLIVKINALDTSILTNPCPGTFQYEIDDKGEVYGKIGVFTFDSKIIKLMVQLSVGNSVQGFNGEISMIESRDTVAENIRKNRPIQYRLYFPQWYNQPPKITQILVNDQLVCSGPPITGTGIRTTINLQHTLTIRQNALLSPNPFIQDFANRPNFNIKPNTQQNEVDNAETDLSFKLPTTLSNNPFLNIPTVKPAVQQTPTFSGNPFLNGDNIPVQPEKPLDSLNDLCGISKVNNPLVVHGTAVQDEAFPWLVALYHLNGPNPSYKCSGSLIAAHHVVTAAHCVQEEDGTQLIPSNLLLILGRINLQTTKSTHSRTIIPSQVFVHPDYYPYDSDIAVIRFTAGITRFSDYIRPICLWSGQNYLAAVVGQRGIVAGWGQNERGEVAAQARQISLPIVSQEQCLRSERSFKYVISNRTFCAGGRNGAGPCNGDSGGGFVMKRSGKWMLRGVVSNSLRAESVREGETLCDLSKFVIFTDASKFGEWLAQFLF